MTLTQHPELPPTPRTGDGLPLRVRPEWWRRLVEEPDASQAGDLYASAERLPLASPATTRGGAELSEVTFLVEGEPGTEWIVHLNGITDRRRETLRPCRLERVPGTRLLGGTFLIPTDAVLSYRLTDVTGLPDDAGGERSGWLEVHRRGIPDPGNPHRMPTPLGGVASVWHGPDAPWSGWPVSEVDGWVETSCDGVTVRVLPGNERVVVCFDAEYWRDLCLGAAVREAGLRHTLVQIGSGTREERAVALTSPEHAAEHLRRGLRAASAVLGREVLHADVVAGESFGGLAVAWLLARHPELVRAGVVQSGSFWHRAGGRWGDEGPGDLLRLLQQGGADVTRPVVVQVGTEEDLLLPLNRAYRDALLQQGAQLGYREVRGGHDYAWWRAGLIEALGELERLQR